MGYGFGVMVAASAAPQTPIADTLRSVKTRPRKAKELTQAIALQKRAYSMASSDEIEPSLQVQFMRAFDILSERRRILSNKVKPGSRNVSIRELSPSEQSKRLSNPRTRPTDYLADAERVLAQAQQASEPPKA